MSSNAAPDPVAAAFFDVDNTMMVGASIFHFAKGLASRGFFTWRDLARFSAKQVRLRVGGEGQEGLRAFLEKRRPKFAK